MNGGSDKRSSVNLDEEMVASPAACGLRRAGEAFEGESGRLTG